VHFHQLKEGQRVGCFVESKKGSFYNQEKFRDELDCDHEASEQAGMSASCCKIQLQETLKAEEIDKEK